MDEARAHASTVWEAVAHKASNLVQTYSSSPSEAVALCGGLMGSGCQAFAQQQPMPAVSPLKGTMSCLRDCNHAGKCVAFKGFCQCPAGWTGEGCLTRERRPCTHETRQWGFTRLDPKVNLTEFRVEEGTEYHPIAGGRSSLCAGTCDDDISLCYCPSDTKYGRIPPGEHSLPGAPPIRKGRPMGQWCQPKQDKEGFPIRWGTVDYDFLFNDKTGWCNAEHPAGRCDCYQDGISGATCETIYEHTCVNQCNGHGECYIGYCQCHKGWFGHDCAYRMEGVEDSPGLEVERPWIADMVYTPATHEPAANATRLRPLIWVYEMPEEYASRMLQYRVDGGFCNHRQFTGGNVTDFKDHNYYQLEMGLHEMLLQSPHRTLDPEEADFFYVPVYTSCLIMPVQNFGDGPYYHSPLSYGGRTVQAGGLLEDAFHWIRAHYPYWNRKGGRDHIWLATHDEGSCWVPNVIRPSIIFSHWGRTDHNHTSWTGYGPDNYSLNISHPLYAPKGNLHRITKGPCYDPVKGEGPEGKAGHLVVPTMRSPKHYARSPLLGYPPVPRTRLGFFKGRMQFENLPYSRGVRQKLARQAWEEDWAGAHNILILDNTNVTQKTYSEFLVESTFCLAIIGKLWDRDGWTSRYEDAILHGCIPVAIMDNVKPILSNIIDEADVSIRVGFDEVGRLPEILKAVPQEEIERLQRNIGRFWRRFAYTSHRVYQKRLRDIQERNLALPALDTDVTLLPEREGMFDLEQSDAMQTILEWLYGRMD
ncbi:hypothetical protein APUTEX25_005444 [Auxenochlorella protothecoides]|uniref:EGF-like domain-containing protein n=2 Tax=Auxenochlorella protothecoides TaxID=3075 RepID=A0A3M7L145_AUXPR|nr:hypothetical protein APUTEX25_005444 [Auxenochlorella protothecoides]|eukprot:RMZ55166.1 hypothetical protein APUTEX25_005444 [Auxenochlorella protothecoides]